DRRGKVIARLADLVAPADQLPGPAKYAVVFGFQERRVEIPIGRDCGGPFQSAFGEILRITHTLTSLVKLPATSARRPFEQTISRITRRKQRDGEETRRLDECGRARRGMQVAGQRSDQERN